MSLFEVLIAFIIFSLTLLGLDAALLYSLHHSKSTYYAGVASEQLNNLIERIFALDHASLPTEQLKIWNQQNRDLMPNGRGTLSYIHDNEYFLIPIISIFWGKEDQQICKKNQIGQSGCLRSAIVPSN